MKKSALFLFVLGIFFAVCAFFIDKVENLPFVLNLLAPQYTKAHSSLIELEKKTILIPADPGFDAIANIFLLKLGEENPSNSLKDIFVTKIERHKPVLAFSKSLVGEYVKLTFSLSNGQSINWSIEKLKETIFAHKTKSIFSFAAIIFFFGIVNTIFAFILQVIDGQRKQGNNPIATVSTSEKVNWLPE